MDGGVGDSPSLGKSTPGARSWLSSCCIRTFPLSLPAIYPRQVSREVAALGGVPSSLSVDRVVPMLRCGFTSGTSAAAYPPAEGKGLTVCLWYRCCPFTPKRPCVCHPIPFPLVRSSGCGAQCVLVPVGPVHAVCLGLGGSPAVRVHGASGPGPAQGGHPHLEAAGRAHCMARPPVGRTRARL
jgi:hypothetical protein